MPLECLLSNSFDGSSVPRHQEASDLITALPRPCSSGFNESERTAVTGADLILSLMLIDDM